ncbi:MAG: ABC transporter ATP-binding protein [Desulfobacterales bacterium]|jgi:ABC-2 type transport system ATP-binding protein
MKVVEIKSLKKSFAGKKVLEGTSMTVYHGDIYGFLGPNGSGKTTTLRILLGNLYSDGGKIAVLGLSPDLDGEQLRQRVNILPESHGFYGWMRAEEYLRFFGQLYGLQLTSANWRMHLEQVGLDPADRRPIRTFSRGMKQRLGIARSLVNDPEILFLDEPTNGLDPKGRRKIHDLLLKLNREKEMTVVISTHILDDVERLCNRIAILHNSKIQYEGPLFAPAVGRSIRYRFHLADDKSIPSTWNFPGISCQEKNGPWVTCKIKDIHPDKALSLLVQKGIPITEAIQVNSGLESMYLNITAQGKE